MLEENKLEKDTFESTISKFVYIAIWFTIISFFTTLLASKLGDVWLIFSSFFMLSSFGLICFVMFRECSVNKNIPEKNNKHFVLQKVKDSLDNFFAYTN